MWLYSAFLLHKHNFVTMAVSNQQNGSAEAPIDLANPTVVGINFGNSYASISVLNKVRVLHLDFNSQH